MLTNKTRPQILSTNTFPVIGIGASAGGLDAFKKLITAIPENSGMAYVLVQHLDPKHESMLPELLQKVTKIPVLEIADEVKVLPDHIYIIPSNKMLVANDGVLQLSERPEKSKNKVNLPIDLFFTSLAEVHQTHAIGVVLSGNATDGTLGLKAIKDLGGITFAQDEASAAYYGMPQNAIQAGVVDFIMPPEAILEKLLEIKAQINLSDEALQNLPQKEETIFKQILSLLRIRSGNDFTYYKQTTIRRRIFRRITLSKAKSLAGYLTYLTENNPELDALYQDLLIPVTAFFRDENIFNTVCVTVFPQILKRKPAGEAIRIWVAACSTGQEAYSIAICLKEFLEDRQEQVQIFATDISAPAIAKARTGIYTKSEIAGISPHRLQEFFTESEGSYLLNKQVREMCVFAVHNFVKEPPFGKMDFVSCRNVLIYMEPYLQKKALTTFHYALNPKGFLLLGKSETSSSAPDLFTISVKNDKLFTRKDVPASFVPVASQRSEQILRNQHSGNKSETMHTDFQKTADDIMLRNYMPPGVIINELMDIVQFRGSTSNYLEQAHGKPSHNLLKMAKNGLAFELRNILLKAKKEKAAVIKHNIPLKVNGSQRTIDIEAIPLPNIVEPHYLILFHNGSAIHNPAESFSNLKTGIKSKKDEKDLYIQRLEKELAQNREDMRSITEDQEAANEELQSANEELLSGSEELQSLNEELETSKEELQSTNEELTSLNEQVTTAWQYAEAIIATIHEPLLVLDKHLRVKKVNDAFYKTFSVNERETEGIIIYELGNKQWDIPKLHTLLEEVLPQKTKMTDYEITNNFPFIGERVMQLNASEIMREKGEEKLILLSIQDITEKNRLYLKEKEFHKDLEAIVKQRTLELSETNEKLLQTNEALAMMNKDLQTFNYISSHDLQEPVRKIKTFAKLIYEHESETLSEKGKDHINRMLVAATLMQTLIQDLLAYAQTNSKEYKFEKTDFNKIVEDVQLELKEIIQGKDAVIETGILGEATIIPFQFRQLFNNLISNSLKFAQPLVQPHIVIKSEIGTGRKWHNKNLASDKTYCHISFADNGIGFDPQYEEKIFEVFQRLNSKEAYPGTGIGLAIVKKIVENHGGIITASGELNKGATFDVYIPVE